MSRFPHKSTEKKPHGSLSTRQNRGHIAAVCAVEDLQQKACVRRKSQNLATPQKRARQNSRNTQENRSKPGAVRPRAGIEYGRRGGIRKHHSSKRLHPVSTRIHGSESGGISEVAQKLLIQSAAKKILTQERQLQTFFIQSFLQAHGFTHWTPFQILRRAAKEKDLVCYLPEILDYCSSRRALTWHERPQKTKPSQSMTKQEEHNRLRMAEALLVNDPVAFSCALNKTSFVAACAATARDLGPSFDQALDTLSGRTKKRN